MVSYAPSTATSSSRNSISSFEFVCRDPANAEEATTPLSIRTFPHDMEPVNTLAELKATIYPPNPTYDISEKPWLPGPQKPYLLLKANLVDPRAGVVHKNMTLQLAGGKVVRVGPTTETEVNGDFYCAGQKVEKIDASKYFVCPGLIDCQWPAVAFTLTPKCRFPS